MNHVWSQLKNKIWQKAINFDSIEELKKIIKQIFKKDEGLRETIKRLYESIPDRIFTVIDRNGRSCGYLKEL